MAKKIKLKSKDIEINGKPSKFDYGETIKAVLRTPGASGLSLEDMRQSIKIIDRLESNGNGLVDRLTLEDSEWNYLKQKLQVFRWGFAHQAIIDLCDAVNNAESIEIK